MGNFDGAADEFLVLRELGGDFLLRPADVDHEAAVDLGRCGSSR